MSVKSLSLVLVALLSLPAVAGDADDRSPRREESSGEAIGLEQVPEPVRASLAKIFPESTLLSASLEDGLYDVRVLTREGTRLEVHVQGDGSKVRVQRALGREGEREEHHEGREEHREGCERGEQEDDD